MLNKKVIKFIEITIFYIFLYKHSFMPRGKNHESDAILKILVIGDSGVGKTNLITRYSGN